MTWSLQGQLFCMICMPAAPYASALQAEESHLEKLGPGGTLQCLCRQLCFVAHG